MNAGLLFLLGAMAFSQPPGQVFPSISIQPDRIYLSGSTQLTLALEGPSPMRIDVPKELDKLLTSEAATVWQIRPIGGAKVTPLDAGRERWEQKFRLSPFVPSEKLTIALAPLKVFAGGQLNSQEIVFPSKEVRVQTTIAEARPDAARGVTGIEDLPVVTPLPPENIGWQFVAVLGAIFATVVVIVWIRKSRTPPPPIPPGEWALRELERLERDHGLERITTLEAAARLAAILREFIERRFGLLAGKLTTSELIIECARAEWPSDHIAAIQEVLERCDRAKFAGDSPSSVALEENIRQLRNFISRTNTVGA